MVGPETCARIWCNQFKAWIIDEVYYHDLKGVVSCVSVI